MKRLFVLVSLSLVCSLASAQFAPRPDDHFWRRRVILVLNLREKINNPLVEVEPGSYVKGADKRFGTRTQGMVNSLVSGWKEGKYTAFKGEGDSLHRTITYSEFAASVQKLNGGPAPDAAPVESTEGGEEGTDDGDFGDFESEGDEFGGGDGAGGEEATDGVATGGAELDLGNLTYRMELIEDRIFDKGRGVMVHDIEFIRLVWVDPDGKVSDRNVVAFKYDDILSVLEVTQWKNRFNDAEDRNIREIFDQRIFNGNVVSVSRNSPNTLQDADRRRVQMIEFEHHLWSY